MDHSTSRLSNPAFDQPLASVNGKMALDLFPNMPIIGRNTYSQMNAFFVLSLIVILIAILIIKDRIPVGMATVSTKK